MRRTLISLLVVVGPGCSSGGGEGSPERDAAVEADAAAEADAGVDAAVDAGDALDAGAPVLGFRDAAGDEVESLFYGAQFHAVAAGLVPGERVTIRAALWGYRSHADFTADDGGTVDLSRDAPVEGTYGGVDPDGLVWSMERINDDVGADYGIDFTLERGGEVVAEARIDRRPMGEGTDSFAVDEDGLVGTLMVPRDAPAPPPVVLVVGGSEGGQPIFTAAYVTTLGYAAFALAYFDEPGLPRRLTDIPLEYFDGAVDWLAAQPTIDPERMAVLGGSRGGELALMLGAEEPRFRAVIAEVPSGLRWGSGSESDRAAWTRDGEVLPYIDTAIETEPVREVLPDGNTAYRESPMYDDILAATDPAVLEAATIAIEGAAGPVLMLAAGDDGLWPSCTLAAFAETRLADSGHADLYGDELVCFPDAGHIFGTPGWPTTESYSLVFAQGYRAVMGGTPEGNGRAAREADVRIRALLERVLGE